MTRSRLNLQLVVVLLLLPRPSWTQASSHWAPSISPPTQKFGNSIFYTGGLKEHSFYKHDFEAGDITHVPGAGKDTISLELDTLEHLHKSSLLAMSLSALLPGAGQYYTERYWKIPIIWGFGAWLGGNWINANKNYVQEFINFRKSVEDSVNHGQGDPEALRRRDFYRDVRDKYIFYSFVVYALNILDAYVGAQLFDFEVTDNLGGNAKVIMRWGIR
jgi:hypothetical protein